MIILFIIFLVYCLYMFIWDCFWFWFLNSEKKVLFLIEKKLSEIFLIFIESVYYNSDYRKCIDFFFLLISVLLIDFYKVDWY